VFSIIMNFTLAGAIGVVGLLTLRRVSAPREVALALLPLLFALHQFTQGFVWLGMQHLIHPRALHMAETIFVFYAQGLLTFLVPLAVWLIEPPGTRRSMIVILVLMGGLLTVYTMWGLAVQPTSVRVDGHTLIYDNTWTEKTWIAVIYILTTCGSLILSSSVAVQLFGWVNIFGLTGVFIVWPYAFTSLWCLYAAAVSVLLYFYFGERRIAFLKEIREKEYEWSDAFERELAVLEGDFPRLRQSIFSRFHL
jgi:hypothetical protein